MNDTLFPSSEMGNCVAMLRVPRSTTEAKCLSSDNAECGSIETSVSKNSVTMRCPSSELCYKPQRSSFREPGSLEETFFDSHPSLDSDYEDYFSVNGDDTPAMNDTPSCTSIARETSQLGRDLNTENAKRTSPNKLLIDLFLGENQNSTQMSEAKPSNTRHVLAKPESKGSYMSMVSFACNGKTRKTCSNSGNGNATKHGKSCVPNLVRNLSFCERKKALSPA